LEGRIGWQRPLPDLRVGRGRQVDPPTWTAGVEVAGEGGEAEPRRRPERLQEATEPALAVDETVGAGPDPELLAVVDERHRPGVAAAVEVAERLLRVGERHEVAQTLADRKHRHRRALLLGH